MAYHIAEKAAEFAKQAHCKQLRRYSNEPYFVHLQEVANLCEDRGLNPNVVAVAWLHDTIEDQPVTYDQIATEFGKEIADNVLALTNEPTIHGGPNRKARKIKDLERLAKASPDAQSVKCADLISNTSDIVKHNPKFARTYLPEKRAILIALTKADPVLRKMAWSALIAAEEALRVAA